LQRPEPGLQLGVRVQCLGQRHHQEEQEQYEGHQVTEPDRAARHPGPADADHEQERRLYRGHRGRPDQGLQPGHPQPGRVRLACRNADRDRLALLGVAGPDGPGRADRPLDRRGHLADPGLRLLGGGPDPAGEQDRHAETGGHPDHGDPEEQRIDEDHADRRADHHDDAGRRLEQAGGDDRAQQRGVRADPGQQVAGTPLVVLGDRQPQQVPGQLLAGRQHHALGRAGEQVVPAPVEHGDDEEYADQQPDVAPHVEVPDAVEHRPGQQRLQQGTPGPEQGQPGDRHQGGPVYPQVRQ